MPIDEIPDYQVICRDDLVANLNKRLDNSDREELLYLIDKLVAQVSDKQLRLALTS